MEALEASMGPIIKLGTEYNMLPINVIPYLTPSMAGDDPGV